MNSGPRAEAGRGGRKRQWQSTYSRTLFGLLAAFTVVAVLATQPAATQAYDTPDPFEADPLGLIAHFDWYREQTLGTQMWELWFCDLPHGDTRVEPSEVARRLNSEITPYFRWLSDNRYIPEFRVAGEVQAEDDNACEQAARAESPDALMAVVTDAADGNAYGGGRTILLSADSVVRTAGRIGPRMEVVGHDIGHTLGWPHSYGGNTRRYDPTEPAWEQSATWTARVSQYDNPMDLMSGAPTNMLNIGTIAVNRYAAGWIDPADVSIHMGGTVTYELVAPGKSGTQMLVLPGERTGLFFTLGARIGDGYDSAVPKHGVEVYRIDQRSPVSESYVTGLSRRTQPYPPAPDSASTSNLHMTDHVYGADETFDIGRFQVAVGERTGRGFRVTVKRGPVPVPDHPPEPGFGGRFSDDDGNVHEANIEIIAELGITVGCNPPHNDRYCPTDRVSRAQAMTFLARALGEEGNPETATSRFSDVPDHAWYLSGLERLADLGVVEPYEDGTFRPYEGLTRLDMAVLLIRAFPAIMNAANPTGVFSDVPADAEHAGAVEGILAAGVTSGCSTDPLSYCPDRPVPRDQMASFLARALKAHR